VLFVKLAKAIGATNRVVGIVLAPGLFVIMLIGTFEVVARYVFDSPTLWAWQVNVMIFSATMLLGGGHALLENVHVKLDILYNHFRPSTRRILDVATSPIVFLFLGMMLWQGWKMAALSIQRDEHSVGLFSPPLYYNRVAFVVAAALVFLQFVATIILTIKHPPAQESHPRETTGEATAGGAQ